MALVYSHYLDRVAPGIRRPSAPRRQPTGSSQGPSLPEPRGSALLHPRGLLLGTRVVEVGSSLVGRRGFRSSSAGRSDASSLAAGDRPAVLSWRAPSLDALHRVVESTRGELAHRRPVAAHEAARLRTP